MEIYQRSASVAINNSSSSYWFSSSPNASLSEARRSFFLVSIFDFLFMILLWLIYCTTKGFSLKEAYESEIVNYDINKSLFDLVVLSSLRFLILSIVYVLVKLIHWLPVAFITFASSSFLITKVLLFALKGTHQNITDYVILILSFVLVWIQAYYLEVKIFSPERKKNIDDSLAASQGINNAGYGSIGRNRHAISDIVSFYSPLDSPNESDNEDNSTIAENVDYTNLSHNSQIKEYEKLAKDMIDKVMTIFNKTEGWKLDKKLNDLSDTCIFTQTFSKVGKIFKLESLLYFDENLVLKLLRDDVVDYPSWDKNVNECQVLQAFPGYLSIIYTLVHEQAAGMVASRDFVNLRKYMKLNELHVIAAMACTHLSKPPVDAIVRGENGPTAYIIKKIAHQKCKITWILNVNLKGWLPQYLIDQSLSAVQLEFISSLKNRLDIMTKNKAQV